MIRAEISKNVDIFSECLTNSLPPLHSGYVDRLDTACGLFPVLYTDKNLAFSAAPVLPNMANTAFLSLVYAGANGYLIWIIR